MSIFIEVNDPQNESLVQAIEKEFNIQFPPLFRKFLLTYYPYQFTFDIEDTSKILIYLNLFQEKIFIPKFIDMQSMRINIDANYEADEQDFGWQLIKVFDSDINPHAGFYLGIGEHNKDILYYIEEELISPDFEYPINTEDLPYSLKNSVTRLTKDIFSFVKFLQIVPNHFELVDFEWE